MVEEQTVRFTTVEIAKALDKVDVPNAPLQTAREAFNHPQTKALGIISEAAGESLPIVRLPLRFNGKRPDVLRTAPKIGEHSAEVLKHLH